MSRPLYAAEALQVNGGWLISALAVPGASAEVVDLRDAGAALTPVIARMSGLDVGTFDVWVSEYLPLQERTR